MIMKMWNELNIPFFQILRAMHSSLLSMDGHVIAFEGNENSDINRIPNHINRGCFRSINSKAGAHDTVDAEDERRFRFFTSEFAYGTFTESTESNALVSTRCKFYIALGPSIPNEILEAETNNFENMARFDVPNGGNALSVAVFSNAKDNAFNFIPPKSMVLSRYEFSRQKPLNVPSIIQQRGSGDILQLECSSDIVICRESVINVRQRLRSIAQETDVDQNVGDIRLFARGSVTNHGTLCCTAHDGGKCGGIYIITDTYVNDGRIECNPNGSIHIFCREYINNGVISPDPKVIESKSQLKSTKYSGSVIDYFLFCLRFNCSNDIEADIFTKNIGLQVRPNWYRAIVEHHLLSQSIGVAVIQKLVRIFKIAFFGMLALVRSSMIIDENGRAILQMKEDIEQSNLSFSDFIFKAVLNTAPSADSRSLTFEKLEDFIVEPDHMFQSEANSLNLNVFCKAKDDSFDFVRIHSMILNRYELIQHTPVFVTESLKVSDSSQALDDRDMLWINCASDIIIAPNVTVDRSGARIFTKGLFRNEGSVRCDGGSIHIVTSGSFINNGELTCAPDGEIVVVCRDYINNGLISPKPKVIRSQQYYPLLTRQDTLSLSKYPLSIIEYFLLCLSKETQFICDKEAFFEKIGVRVESDWIQPLADHKALYESTLSGPGIENMDDVASSKFINRLGSELDIEFFRLYDAIWNLLTLNDDGDVVLNDRKLMPPKRNSESLVVNRDVKLETSSFFESMQMMPYYSEDEDSDNGSSSPRTTFFSRLYDDIWNLQMQDDDGAVVLNDRKLMPPKSDSECLVVNRGKERGVRSPPRLSPNPVSESRSRSSSLSGRGSTRPRSPRPQGRGRGRGRDRIGNAKSNVNLNDISETKTDSASETKTKQNEVLPINDNESNNASASPNSTLLKNTRRGRGGRGMPSSRSRGRSGSIRSKIRGRRRVSRGAAKSNSERSDMITSNAERNDISSSLTEQNVVRSKPEDHTRNVSDISSPRTTFFFRLYDDIWNLQMLNENESLSILTSFVFMVRSGFEDQSEIKEFQFEEASQFRIPNESKADESAITPQCVFAKHRSDEPSEFIRIKTLLKRRYIVEEAAPLQITNSLEIPPFDRTENQSGTLVVKCDSDIVIAPKITIKGSDMSNAKGPSLMLMSNGDVTNQGTLCCNGLGDGEGGDMYIVSDAFVNDGEMESTPNGRIFVFCREFKNNGRISPVPEVIITSTDEVKSQNDDGNNDEKLLLPLRLAAKPGNDGIVDLLMEWGAFHIAVKYGQSDVVKMLYEHLVKVKRPKEVDDVMNCGYGDNGRTILHFACMGGHEDIARYLVDTIKVDIFRKDNDNKTAMDYAVQNGHQSIAEWMSQLKTHWM